MESAQGLCVEAWYYTRTRAHRHTHMLTIIGARHGNGVWQQGVDGRRKEVCAPAIGVALVPRAPGVLVSHLCRWGGLGSSSCEAVAMAR